MSSYQFVNSLASCYQQGQPPRPGGSPLDTGSPTSDYYAPNAGVVPSYGATTGCYSPQQYAGQYMQQSPTGMMDYTQLHTAQQHQRLTGVHLQQLHHHHQTLASPGAMSPILNNNNNTTVTNLGSASCKYEVNSQTNAVSAATTNGIGSPQDLTTSAQPNRTPPLSTGQIKSVTPSRTPGGSGASPSAAQSSGPASQSSSSPASSTSSSSPGGNNSSSVGGKSGSSGNPPQIYPWMKRVHLGQKFTCGSSLFVSFRPSYPRLLPIPKLVTMEVEIEVDPSPLTPSKSPGRKTIPIVIEQHPAMTLPSAEESLDAEIMRPPSPAFGSTDPLITRRRMQYSEDQRRRDELMEREYQRITNSIDFMIHSQYTALSTRIFMGFFFMAVCLIALIVMVANSNLPKGLKETDPGSVETQRFISERSMKYIRDLTNFGPRLIGSYENEYLAFNYLKREVERIKQQAPVEWNEIEVDTQVASGSFTEGPNVAKNYLKQIVYQNIQNVVAKLSPKRNVAESILVNCHFDSFSTSPGTSDDGLNCAVMLEVLRVMAKTDHSLKRNVIFLFNGGEEDGVSGSHGFITKHKWIDEIICFVNLDAGGAGGRQVLYQSGPKSSVLPKIYSRSVPHPHANVLGEELFQSGMVPSGTDFIIFHKHSKQKLKGLDFAHVNNGYVYHTSSDNISMITEDVVQLTGDNLLALLQALVEYDHLKKDLLTDNWNSIYYDIFGFFVICYSTVVGFLINKIVVFVSLYCCVSKLFYIFRGKPVKLMLQHVLIDLVFVVGGIVAVTIVLYLLASLLKLKDATMLWYSHQWFVLSYYGSPVLLVMFMAVKVRREFIYSLLNGEQEAKVFIFVIQFIMTVILSLGTLSGIRSSFILAIGLIGVSISHYFLNKTKLKFEIAVYKFITYGIINFVPALYCAYVFIPFVQTIIPMMGRMGAHFDNEDVIWIVTEVFVLITFAYFIPLVLMVREFWTMQYVFTAMYIAQVIFVFVNGLSPFSDTAMERFYALHVDRKLVYGENTFKNETTGYLVSPNDIRGGGNILNLFKEHKFQQVNNTDNCTVELFCGMPTLISTTPGLIERDFSFWTPKEAPKIPHLKQLNCTMLDNGYDFRTFNLTLNGSKFMDAVILPLNGAKLVQWSLNPSIPGNDLKWNGQPVYFIRYHEGSLNRSSLSFSMKFDVLQLRNKNDHVFKLAWTVFYPTNSTDSYTPQFKKFIDEFPSWSRVVPMVVEYEEFLLPDLS